MALSESQNEALEHLWSITASDSPAARERDEKLLRENGFNIEATVEQIFALGPSSTTSRAGPSGGSTPSGPTFPPRTQYGNDDANASDSASLLNGSGTSDDRSGSSSAPASRRRSGTSGTGRVGNVGIGAGSGSNSSGVVGIFSLIAWPATLVWSVITGGWYLFLRTFMPLSFLRNLPPYLRPPSSPTGASPRPRRALDPMQATMSFISDLEAATSTTAGNDTWPQLYMGPYREFIQTVKKDGKVGVIILCCAEHEDDLTFKREVLMDEELIRTFKEKDMLVWAADVRTREGYQVGQTLLATAYPSIYFVSLLPPPSTSGGSSPKLAILSCLSGSPSTATSASQILQTISTSIVPRTSAFLARLKRERLTLEEARHLREEQDRAFREAERRDREKARVAKEQADLERVKREREEREANERIASIEKRQIWRRYARRHLLSPSEGPIRVAIRTPLSAERNMRFFKPTASTEELFVYAETLLIPSENSPADDPDVPPEGYTPPEDFRLVTTYPRKEVERTSVGGEQAWDVVKQAGGALIAEKIEGGTWAEAELKAIRAAKGEDSDEEEADD